VYILLVSALPELGIIDLLKRLLCVNRKLIFSVTAPLVGIETLYFQYFTLSFYFILLCSLCTIS